MKLVPTGGEIDTELSRLIRKCSSCQIAVAWASVGFTAFKLLAKHENKIERMVVGTHFYQTHPKFIQQFLSTASVRFVLNPSGVFHPKVYLFKMPDGGWECLIGSSNFTQGGIGTNDEMAILVSNNDSGAIEVFAGVKATIAGYWHKAKLLSQDEYLAYAESWKRLRPTLRSLSGSFGDPDRDGSDDGGRTTLEIPILRMSWAEYYERIRTEHNHSAHDHSMSGRLKVIRAMRHLFTGT